MNTTTLPHNANEFTTYITVHADRFSNAAIVRDCPRAIDIAGYCLNCNFPVERIEKQPEPFPTDEADERRRATIWAKR